MFTELKRYSEYLLLILLVSFFVVKGIIPGWVRVHTDFSNYYISAKLISDHYSLDPLYNNEWFHQKALELGSPAPGKFAPFPPITAWVMLPLSSFDILTAQRIFLTINLFFLGLGIFIVRKLTQWSLVRITIFILLSGWGLVNNFSFGQLYLIMAVCMLVSYYWLLQMKSVGSGILLSIFTAIKYFPVIFIGGNVLELLTHPKPIKNNKARLVAVFLITLGFLFTAQCIFFGKNIMSDFFQSAFLPHLDGKLKGQGLYSFEFQSWDGLLRNLFVFDPNENPKPFIDWPIGKIIFKSVIFLFLLVSIFLTLYQFRKENLNQRQLAFISVPVLAALVVLPASATYHFILLIFPLVLLLSSDLLEKRIKTIVIVLYALIGFLPYGVAFEMGRSFGVFFAYPRLWLVSLVYLVTLYGLWKQKSKV